MESAIHLIPTRCTPLCSDKYPPFQFKVHHYDALSLPVNPKGHKMANSLPSTAGVEPTNPEREMKRFRYDVMKFSASKLEGREREEADVSLAVSLGAVPPKKECINYKELLQIKRKSKEVADVKPHSIAMLKAKLKGKNKINKGKKKHKVKEKKQVTILQSYGKPSKKVKNKSETVKLKK